MLGSTGSKPQTPTTPRVVTIGGTGSATFGSVSVLQPADSLLSKAHRAAPISPGVNTSSGGQAEASVSSASSGNSMTTPRAPSVLWA